MSWARISISLAQGSEREKSIPKWVDASLPQRSFSPTRLGQIFQAIPPAYDHTLKKWFAMANQGEYGTEMDSKNHTLILL
jgi:hypothetical protein